MTREEITNSRAYQVSKAALEKQQAVTYGDMNTF